MKWIKVSDRLPEAIDCDEDQTKMYLVIDTNGLQWVAQYLCYPKSDERKTCWWSIYTENEMKCCGCQLHDFDEAAATHWMELPSLPKDK